MSRVLTITLVLLVPATTRGEPLTAPSAELEVGADPHDAAPREPTRVSQLSARRLRALLARYRHEPTCSEVVDAARAALGRPATRGMSSRARVAGWIPTVGLSARRGQAVDLSSPSSTATDDALRLSTDEDLTLTASLTFELDRVLFRHEETSIAREARAEREARDGRLREVVRLYFLRRRLQIERDLGAGDAVAHALGIAEAEAMLDAFTAGAFGRMIRASERRRDGESPRT